MSDGVESVVSLVSASSSTPDGARADFAPRRSRRRRLSIVSPDPPDVLDMSLAASHPWQCGTLALVLALMLTPVLCAGAAAVFVYRRSRRSQSQHVSVFSLGAVEEGCLDPTADVDVQEKGEVRTQDAHIVRPGEDWDALPRWSTQVVAAQYTAPDTPEASSTPAERSRSISPLDSSVSITFDSTIMTTCQARKHVDGSLSGSSTRSVVSTPSLVSCADAPEVDSDYSACWETQTPIPVSSSMVSVTLDSDSAVDVSCLLRKHDCHPSTASSSMVSTPSLVSCASTPSCASTLDVDPDPSVCWEIPSKTPPLSTSATPTPVSSSIYLYKRLSSPFADGCADKLQSMDVPASDFASPTARLKSKTLSPPESSIDRKPVASERPRSVGVGRTRPVSGVGVGFNYMLGFDFPFVVGDEVAGSLLDDDDNDEAVSAASTSQTIGALSESPSAPNVSPDTDIVKDNLGRLLTPASGFRASLRRWRFRSQVFS
ncbi:hypothetical protein K466DRAFT_360104 [Polyporus arcularius HHB13444]|uniref:Uncharacterized protein n=1 Tax=Polyporus arcularius HHB13444 TaxID=1314778 RepID=A0A5C3NVZ8_9APHY|nr:hypothetical protein K466DRAFT_360104 [Polyporus arcularius HHB13444]